MAADSTPGFSALLQSFGKDIGLEGMTLDEEGYLALQTEAGTSVHCQVEDGRLMLLASLGRLPTGEKSAPAMKSLLAANALWEGTRGATLSIEPTSDEVLLAQRWTLAELEKTGIQSALETFLAVITHWTGFLRVGDATPSSAEGGIVDTHNLV
jgi:hypothetical protein